MEKKLVTIKINNCEYPVQEGITILEACKRAGIEVPTLCYLEDVAKNASCCVCVVQVKGAKSLVLSCTACVYEGTEIVTNSARIRDARKTNVELLLANNPKDCQVEASRSSTYLLITRKIVSHVFAIRIVSCKLYPQSQG